MDQHNEVALNGCRMELVLYNLPLASISSPCMHKQVLECDTAR